MVAAAVAFAPCLPLPLPRHPHPACPARPSIPSAMCVSRSWRAAVEACPDLWGHCDLACGRRCRPTDAALARAAPRWRDLRWLSLAGVVGVGDAGLRAVAESCPRLASLSLAHCTRFTDRGLAAALAIMLLRPAAPDGSSGPLRRLDLSFMQARAVLLTGALLLCRQAAGLQRQVAAGR